MKTWPNAPPSSVLGANRTATAESESSGPTIRPSSSNRMSQAASAPAVWRSAQPIRTSASKTRLIVHATT